MIVSTRFTLEDGSTVAGDAKQMTEADYEDTKSIVAASIAGDGWMSLEHGSSITYVATRNVRKVTFTEHNPEDLYPDA